MTVIAQIEQTALTPNRQTSITWDIEEGVLTEPVFFLRREGNEIFPRTLSGVERLASGVWILSPINDVSNLHEQEASHPYTFRLSEFTAASVVREINLYRPLTELSGIGTSTAADTAGDYWFTKRVGAGATWNNTISAGPQPTLASANVPLDRIMRSTITAEAMTGYMVRCFLPGAAFTTPDTLLGFQFGGEVYGAGASPHTGFGLYEIIIRGNGKALLFEWIDGAWAQVAEWQFQTPKESAHTFLNLRIIPHFPRYVEFLTAVGGFDSLLDLLSKTRQSVVTRRPPENSTLGTYVHEVTNRGIQAQAPGPGALQPITGPGRVCFDLRRDLRALWTIARIAYPTSGVLTDRNFVIPYAPTNHHVLRAAAIGYNYFVEASQKTSMSVVLQTAAGAALTPGAETFVYRGVSYALSGDLPPGGENACRAVVTLSNSEDASSRWHTPSFTAFQVVRNGHRAIHSPGTKTGGSLQRVSISGPGLQPDHETGFLHIEDEKNALQVVRTRGKIGVRIETSWTATNPDSKVVLFEGYSGRVTASLKGTRSTSYHYPSPEWRRLDCELLGKWDRLAGKFFYQRYAFADSSWSPSGLIPGPNPCWKVTDIIRFVLQVEGGFSDGQLDIPDLDTQLFGRVGESAETALVPAPGTPVADYIWMLCRDYLNATLTWCANAGSEGGMWRLKRPPTGEETPLWNFTTQAPTLAGPLLAYKDGAYGAKTSPVLGLAPFETFIVPPEGNVLTVTGGVSTVPGTAREIVSRSLYNPKSWNLPGASTADPASIDYIGRIQPVEYVDPTLTDQLAVDWFARRIFNLACRGRKFARFTAALALVDPGEPAIYTTRERRPLRAGDLVHLDGDPWIVHACDPDYEDDVMQTARYELELFRADNTWWR